MSSDVIEELLVGLGFDYDPDDLEQFNNDLENTVDIAKKFAASIVVGTTALVGFVSAVTSASDEQGKLAEEIGLSVEKLDALEFANKKAGGEADVLANSLRDLSIRIGEASRDTGEGVEIFKLLGITIKDTNGELKSTDNIFVEVAKSLEGLSEIKQIELADKLGLKDTVRLLQQGKTGVSEFIHEAELLGVTTKEDAKLSAEFQDSLLDIWRIVKQLSRVITRSLVPSMQKISKSFVDWWKINREIIEQNIPLYIDRAVLALKLLSIGVIAFISLRLAATLASLITLLKGMSAWSIIASGSIAALPLLIASAITSLALLAEDAKVFFEGGDSFIGDMIEKYPQWQGQIETIALVFLKLADLTTLIFNGWKNIFELFETNIVDDLRRNIKQATKDLNEAGKSFSDQTILPVIDEAKSNTKKFLKDIKSDIQNLFGNKPTSTNIEATDNTRLFVETDYNDEKIIENISAQIDNIKVPDDILINVSAKINEIDVPENTTIDISNTLTSIDIPSDLMTNISTEIDNIDIPDDMIINVSAKVDEIEFPSDMMNVAISNVSDGIALNANLTGLPESVSVKSNISNSTDEIINRIAQSIKSNSVSNGLSKGSKDNSIISDNIMNQSDLSKVINNVTTKNYNGDVTIQVDGSNSPEETARQIREEIESMTEQTSIDLNSAVGL